MKKFTKLLCLLLLSISVGNIYAQTVLSTETFPNTFNTGFTKPINSTFTGSAGTWSAYSNNSYATVSVNGGAYKSSPYALELLNYNTASFSSTTYAIAYSPTYNCTNVCASSINLCFDLNTFCINSSNSSYCLYVEVSKDNGSTYTTIFAKTAPQLCAAYGAGTWSNICLTLPSTFNNSSLKFRFSGAQAGNCAQNTYVYIDDVTVRYTPCAKVNVGNLVWLDLNGNNTKDATEPGVPNATVNLYADANNDNIADGAAIGTTTTNASGNYSFTNLNAGNYVVGVIIPTNYTRSGAVSVDPDDNVDNDNNAVTQVGASSAGGEMRSKAITLLQGTEPTTDGDDNNGNQTLDFALCPAANLLCLGNLVWLDSNGNNVKDATEPGIANATVNLYADANNDNVVDGAAVATTTTNASGNYTFTGLNGGNYIVGVIIPAGYTKGAASSADPDNDVDNDNNGVNLIGANQGGGEVRALAITLTPFSEPTTDGDGNNGNLTDDIALCPAPANLTVGNLVWLDLNANNVKDATEPVIPNATVNLYKDANNDNIADGASVATTTTNSNGNYTFTGLAAGNYIVGVIIPSNYQARLNGNVDPDNDVDNDNNGVTLAGANQPGSEVRSNAITLLQATEPTTDGDDNNSNLTLDFGMCPIFSKLTLGNLVWLDINSNNLKDATEPGIPNATVYLYADANNDNIADGAAIATTTTNASGMYTFTNLNAGNYILGVIIPSGYTRGPVTTVDADNDVDNDNNGVNLIGANQPGSEVRSLAITLSQFTEPTNDGDDNNANQTLDIALCPAPLLKLGNCVWVDNNANGIKDAGEPGVPNATVYLYKDDNNDNIADGAAIGTTSTDANGTYGFSNLSGGNYIVGVVLPTGYGQGPISSIDPDNDVDNDNNSVNLVGNEVRSLTITLALYTEPTTDGDDNNANQTLDFALYPTICNLGNFVWNDYDGDGKKDPNEPGIPSVPVSIYRDDNGDNIPDKTLPLLTINTNGQGFYSFPNLTPGKYITSIPVLPGYTSSPGLTGPNPNNDVDNDNNGVIVKNSVIYTNFITLTVGGEPTTDGDGANGNLTHDMALCGNAYIGDFVWNDLNGNGIQDAGEPGINGQTVTILFTDGVTTATTTTLNFNGTDGYYNFPNLGPGTHVVTFTTPSGLTPTLSNQGIDDTKDSDPVNGSVSVNVVADISNFTIDAGFKAPSILSLGNLVFIDLNGNGVRDLSEPGIPGATVNLYRDTNGDNAADGAAIATATTANDGTYQFNNLSAGNYIVGVVIPTGYGFIGVYNALPNNDIDNDNNAVRQVGNEVRTNFIMLAPGTEPTNDGDGNNSNLTLDIAMLVNASCRINGVKYEQKGIGLPTAETVSNGVSIYPNPAISNFTIKLNAEKQSIAAVWITDMSGKIVVTKNMNLSQGSNLIQMIIADNLRSGVYNVQSVIDGKVISKRLVIAK